MILVAQRWMLRLTSKTLRYSLQYHADQSVEDLRTFWGALLGIDGERISLQRKSNSNQLTGRTWRCRYGVMSVTSHDTPLRAKLEAWMDRLRAEWSVESSLRDVAKSGIAPPLGGGERRFESGRPDLQSSPVRESGLQPCDHRPQAPVAQLDRATDF